MRPSAYSLHAISSSPPAHAPSLHCPCPQIEEETRSLCTHTSSTVAIERLF